MYPFVISPNLVPIEALACMGKHKAFINEFVFYQVDNVAIDVLYGGEILATWTGTEWIGPLKENRQ